MSASWSFLSFCCEGTLAWMASSWIKTLTKSESCLFFILFHYLKMPFSLSMHKVAIEQKYLPLTSHILLRISKQDYLYFQYITKMCVNPWQCVYVCNSYNINVITQNCLLWATFTFVTILTTWASDRWMFSL